MFGINKKINSLASKNPEHADVEISINKKQIAWDRQMLNTPTMKFSSTKEAIF